MISVYRLRLVAPLFLLIALAACASSGNKAAPGETAGPVPAARIDDDVLRARVAVADLLKAMNARDTSELEARYAIRARTRELTELTRILDRNTGPAELHVHLLEDPTVTGEGTHPTILFNTEFRWRSAAGLSRTLRVSFRATALREGGMFLIATVFPQGEFSW